MSQLAIVGRAQDGRIMVGTVDGAHVMLDVAGARHVRDELVRLLLAEAERVVGTLTLADFREENAS
jgi:2-keto-4-pentenoate hydratase